MMDGAVLELPADRSSPSAARRWVRPMVEGRIDDVEGVLLCVSEIVTNAVLHAQTPCELSVHWYDDRLPVPRELSQTASTGRGLHIIDGCTDAWGVDRQPDAKTVWFELELDDEGMSA